MTVLLWSIIIIDHNKTIFIKINVDFCNLKKNKGIIKLATFHLINLFNVKKSCCLFSEQYCKVISVFFMW